MDGKSILQGELNTLTDKEETAEEIHKRIDEWFASDELKAHRKYCLQQDEIVEKVGQLTKECKNEYKVILYFNDKKTWFSGDCYLMCELSRVCKKGKRSEIYVDKDGIENLMRH